MKRCSVQEIANFLIWDSHEVGSFICNAKLQKLLYYAQAWHLAIHGKPLFGGKFEAGSHGPVLRSVYNRFEHFGWRSIDEFTPKPDLDPETVRFLRKILEDYGALDARKLECSIRQEAPWLNARKKSGVGLDEPCETHIEEDDMRDFYRDRMNTASVEAEA